jgi:hypothetical protein
MAAPVDALRPPRLPQGGVGGFLPQQPHPVASALLGQQRHPPAGVDVSVPDDQVGVRVRSIVPGLVDRRQPRRPARRQLLGKAAHQLGTLPSIKFAGQRQHDLVDDAGVLTVGLLLSVEPAAGGVSLDRHSRAQQLGLHVRPGDVADVRSGGAGRMRAPADAADVQAVDRDPRPRSLDPFTAAAPVPAGRKGVFVKQKHIWLPVPSRTAAAHPHTSQGDV